MAEKPRVYIFHGDDQVASDHAIAELVKKMGDPGTAELNTSRLDGRQTNISGLRSAAFALPFLADHRMVILANPLSMAGGADHQKKFIALLNELPATTKLVLVVADETERGKWAILGKHPWLRQWYEETKPLGFWQECVQPSNLAMPAWIVKQAKKMGGEISPEAAQALADHTGGDTRLAANELDKLLTYTNRNRPVSAADIELLVTPGGPVDIFEVIDRLSSGQAPQALHLLTDLLDQTPAKEIFPMAVRQFRLLIQVRALLDEGGPAQVFTEMPKLPFANKYIQQASRTSLAALETTYHHLAEMDEAVKNSQLTYELALEMLVLELAK